MRSPQSDTAPKAMRPLRPKDEQDASQMPLSSFPATPKSNKRRCVSSACIPCRKRKSKCDGGMPDCSTCVAVYQTPCSYDVDSDHRRKAALKRDITTLEDQNKALYIVLDSLRTSSESRLPDIVQQIRAGETIDIVVLAGSLKASERAEQSERFEGSGEKSAERDLSNILGGSAIDADGVVIHYGHTSHLGLVKDGEHSPKHVQTSAWTEVTEDLAFVQHLLELYFCWAHPFYSLFSKDDFLTDMTNGRSQYCSPLLLNAVLSFGCAYSDRPEARMNHHDPSTAGDHFFAEAKRLLAENDTSSLTTIQALAIMGLREASCARDSSGFQLAGRSMRMLIELGLHLSSGSSDDSLDPNEVEARKTTFWGCFIYDTAWSICIGRIGQLPRTAINVERPQVRDQVDSQYWTPYTDGAEEITPAVDKPVLTHSLAYYFALLSEIVNDTVFMFYAPREQFTSKKLLGFHERYSQWFKTLPTKLRTYDRATPHIITLHIYYHTVIIHLFRPFLKVNLKQSKLDPRNICSESASEIAELLSQYRRVYGLRRVHLMMTHCILASSIIHLINLPKATHSYDLAQGFSALEEISSNHEFARRYLKIIIALARQWSIPLPHELALYDLPPVNSSSSQGYLGYPSPGLSNNSLYQDYAVGNCIANELPFTAIKNSPGTFAQPQEMFWTPVKNQNVPLHASSGFAQATRPMDMNNLIGWDLNNAGFVMADFGNDLLDPIDWDRSSHVNVNPHAQLNSFATSQGASHGHSQWPS